MSLFVQSKLCEMFAILSLSNAGSEQKLEIQNCVL